MTGFIDAIRLAATLSGQPDTSSIDEQVKEQLIPKNNIEYHIAEENSKARLNLFWKPTNNTKAYTFIEMDSKGYFHKSMIDLSVSEKLALYAEVKNSNKFKDHAGIGLKMKFPKGFIKAVPLWTEEGKVKENYSTIGGMIKQSFPVLGKKVVVSAFGELNLAAKKGPSWNYGEINIQVPVGRFDLGAGVNLYGTKTPIADSQDFGIRKDARFKIAYHF